MFLSHGVKHLQQPSLSHTTHHIVERRELDKVNIQKEENVRERAE